MSAPSSGLVALPGMEPVASVDRAQLIRVIADALDALGLPGSSACVLAEANALTPHDALMESLCRAMDEQRWLEAVEALQRLPDGDDASKRARARLALLQEQFVWLLREDSLSEALALLRTDLCRACTLTAQADLPLLATLAACDKTQLAERFAQLRALQSQRWRGAANTRAFVLESLSPDIRCPPGRLLHLISQAMQHQLGERYVPYTLPLYEDVDGLISRRNATLVPTRPSLMLSASSQVWALALSPDEAFVAMGLSDGSLVVVHLSSHASVSARNAYPISQLEWSATSGILCVMQGPRRGVSNISGSLVKVWNGVLTSHVSLSGALHDGTPCATWVNKGTVVTSGPDARVQLWSPDTGARLSGFAVEERVLDVCSGGDASTSLILAACVDSKVRGLDAHSGAQLFAIDVDAPIVCMSASASRLHIALVLKDDVEVINVKSRRRVAKFPLARSRFVHRAALDDDYVFAGDEKGCVLIHALHAAPGDAEPLACLQGHCGPVNVVVLGQNPRVVLSGSDDGSVRAWAV